MARAVSETRDRKFPTTRWSVVVSARGASTLGARDALGTLCENYWYPLYAFARKRGAQPSEAEDLTQAFFTRLLERRGLPEVGESRGRFRHYLLACFRNHWANTRREASAEKRGGGRRVLSLDVEEGEARYAREPVDTLTPEKLYDRQWALTILERALRGVEAQLRAAGHGELFDAIGPLLSGASHDLTYADLAARLGSTAEAVRAAVYRARRRYADLVRAEIAQTVTDPSEIESEVAALMEAVRG